MRCTFSNAQAGCYPDQSSTSSVLNLPVQLGDHCNDSASLPSPPSPELPSTCTRKRHLLKDQEPILHPATATTPSKRCHVFGEWNVSPMCKLYIISIHVAWCFPVWLSVSAAILLDLAPESVQDTSKQWKIMGLYICHEKALWPCGVVNSGPFTSSTRFHYVLLQLRRGSM